MLGIGALLASGLNTIVVAEPAEASMTQNLVSQASLPSLAAALAVQSYPSGSDDVVLVPEGDNSIVAQAAVLAASLDAAMLVAPSTTDATQINVWLATLATKKVYLFGAAGSFTPAFRTDLTPAVSVAADIADPTPFGRSVAAANLVEPRAIVVTNDATISDATAFAAAARIALVLTDGTESPSALSAFFAGRSDQTVTIAGSIDSFDLSLLPSAQAEKIEYLRTQNLKESYWKSALQSVAGGADGAKAYASVGDSLSNMAVTALAARAQGATYIGAGSSGSFASESAAHEYMAAWGPELRSVTLAGVDATDAMLRSLTDAALVTRSTAVGWNLQELKVIDGNFVYTLGDIPGAASYEAYNSDLLGSSQTATVSVPVSSGVPYYFVAKDAAGVKIDEMTFRQNEYVDPSSDSTALYGSVRAGYHHLKWEGAAQVPRMVSRIEVDPFAFDPMNPPGNPETRVVVAITCGPEYFDGPLDKTKQWVYQVDVLGTSGKSCNGTDSSLIDLPSSVVTLPSIEYPVWMRPSSNESLLLSDTRGVTPGYTIADMTIARSTAHSNATAGVSKGSVGPQVVSGEATPDLTAAPSASEEADYPLILIYETYIPESKIAVPGYSGDLNKPVIAFHGDGRAWYSLDGGMAENQSRTLLNQFFTFGPTHTGNLYKKMGETIQFKCASVSLTNCVETARATAPLSSISGSYSSYANGADASMTVDASIPLYPAPAISGTMNWKVRQGGSSVVGTHDRMPVHQLWYGNYQADAYLIYRNDFYNPVCLSGLPALVCRAHVNAQF